MSTWVNDLVNIAFAVILVFINGFFVAAEFALVKVRPGRLDELVRQGRIFATTAKWLWQRMDASLSACQLGITMASLGLGWIGEPAVRRAGAQDIRPAATGNHSVVVCPADEIFLLSFLPVYDCPQFHDLIFAAKNRY